MNRPWRRTAVALGLWVLGCGSDPEPTGEPGSGGTAGTGGAGASSTGGSGPQGGGGAAPIVRVNTCIGPASAALSEVTLPAGYCAWRWAADVAGARGVKVDADGNVLVLSRDRDEVIALWDDDGDGVAAADERMAVAGAPGLNHGIALHQGFLYASSDTDVYRWTYSPRQELGAPDTVVTGLPAGGHSTRTLLFDDDDFLYVTIGSATNVDADSSRSRMIRYALADLEAGPQPFAAGEVFADGLRNEVGIALDAAGRLWGVENGLDNLSRVDLGGDIHNDNPGEELNLFGSPGAFYGYPYCWSEFILPAPHGLGPGSQWAHPDFMNDGTHTDDWCRDPNNVVPPVLSLQSHAAPLDILFYPGGSFPNDTVGDAIVSYHGSWNHTPAIGRSVVRVPFGADGMPSGDPVPLLEYASADVSAFPHRPVGLAVSAAGMLLVTSDSSDQVIAIGHDGS